MQITGTFTTAAASGYMLLMPGEALLLGLTVGEGLEFSGRVVVERSRDGGQTWHRVDGLDYNGVAVAIAAGVAASVRLVNESGGREFYRVRNITATSDDGIGYVIVRDAVGSLVEEKVVEITISAANIVDTAAGQLGHADGFVLVAAPGADFAIELVSALMVCDRLTAAYTDGGNVTINAAGGAALTGVVSAANSLVAATDKVALFRPLTAAGEILAANTGLNLVAAAAFTNPGTAAGVVRVRVRYRLHRLGLV